MHKFPVMLGMMMAAVLWQPAYAAELGSRSAKEVLASGNTPEEKGLQVVKEADARDFGFGDQQVKLEMVLRNASGQENRRVQRSKTLEMQDPSVGDKTLIVFDNPRTVKGTAFLTFSKILEADDQWLYLPSLKRVKRISSKNKSGPFVGSEFAYEDLSSQEVGKYSYRYVRNESCGALECFVVEYRPKYEYSGYTRLIAWVDTSEFRLQKVEYYDRKNELLKTLTYDGYKQYLSKYWRPAHMYMVNHQTGKSTDLHWKEYEFRTGLSAGEFTPDVLRRVK